MMGVDLGALRYGALFEDGRDVELRGFGKSLGLTWRAASYINNTCKYHNYSLQDS